MINILIVDDSKLITNALSSMIKEKLGFNCLVSDSLKSTAEILLKQKGKFDVALLDLGLPDAPNGEVVDFITKFNIPSIVLTGSDIEEDNFRNKNIVDYVIKDGSHSLEYAVNVVKRIISNKEIKVLVVDDSKITCERFSELLQRYQLQTHIAYSSKECLEVLEDHPDIKLIYIDYLMPNMDGLALTREIRKRFAKDELSIIALSGEDSKKLTSKFLKSGANDFIYKGFSEEEFFVRLNSNLEILEIFEEQKEKANKDYLTGMYNRRYFFDEGHELFQRRKYREDNTLTVAIIDIDNFKNINDKYGHDIGDIAIKESAKILKKHFSNNCLLARLGGEEFCVIVKGRKKEEIETIFEDLRKAFENNKLKVKEEEINFTISIGVNNEKKDDLTEMLNNSDKALYRAKRLGRNRIEYFKS